MSEETPPTYNTSVFNQANFNQYSAIDTEYLNANYVKYPVTQTGLITIANLATTNDASIYGLTVGRGKSSIASNTALGISALAANTSGTENTAVGSSALQLATTASQNTALGHESLYNTTTGGTQTALGFHAARNATGSNNVAIGYRAFRGTLGSNAGVDNIAIGSDSVFNGGTRAIGIGVEALYNGGGVDCVAIGYKSLHENPGANNTGVGHQSLNAVNTGGSSNTALGFQAGQSNTSGSNNTYIGYQAGSAGTAITTGSNNTFIGYQAQSNSAIITNSTAIGVGAVASASNQIVIGRSTEKLYYGGSSSYAPYIVAVGTAVLAATAGAGRVQLPGSFTVPSNYTSLVVVVSNGDIGANLTTSITGACTNISPCQVWVHFNNATAGNFRANYIIYAV